MADEGRLAGHIALVTGSTRGIGRVVAERLAREGASVVVHGRERDDVERAAREIAALGGETWAVAADLSRLADMHRLAAETLAAVPQLDILVNNAGMSMRENFWDVSDDRWDYQVNVNFRAPFVLSQHVARQMIERGIRGRIVNTSTVGAHRCHKDAAVYDSAKAAVEAMTRNLAYELAPHGVAVNCVIPGPIADRPGAPESHRSWRHIAPYVPVGRLGSAADVAAAVLFFCLPESGFTTGQSLLIDGGYGAPLAENYLASETDG
jgi:NAD(P)-dependent dehydrogenase (short-subunit alcohol dehydrogenase family)